MMFGQQLSSILVLAKHFERGVKVYNLQFLEKGDIFEGFLEATLFQIISNISVSSFGEISKD